MVTMATKVRMCYFANWSQYRRAPLGPLRPADIDPFLCTHIIYAHAHVDVGGTTLSYTEMTDPGECT